MKEHRWTITGREEVRQVLRNGHPNGYQLYKFVRCTCGAIGFRRTPSNVVYTWEHETS